MAASVGPPEAAPWISAAVLGMDGFVLGSRIPNPLHPSTVNLQVELMARRQGGGATPMQMRQPEPESSATGELAALFAKRQIFN